MSSLWKRAAAASLIALVGCDIDAGSGFKSKGDLPPGYVAPAATENLPLVDHPEYVSWSRIPVGISVVRTKEVSSASETIRATTILRLIEKSADKVVVESQITVDRPGQPLTKNPASKIEFPATFRLPRRMQLAQFLLPSLKAKAMGEEIREVCGKEYKAQLFTWDEVNEAGPMAVKLWRSDEIPGRMLRQEINGRTQTSVEEVVEIVELTKEAVGGPHAPSR